MNSRSIQKLRIKIILISMLSLFLAMLFMGLLINVMNYISTDNQMSQITNYIIENDGEIGEKKDFKQGSETTADTSQAKLSEPYMTSPEFTYSTRYFTVIYGTDGTVQNVNINHIAAVDESTAEDYASTVYNNGRESSGRKNEYYYQTATLDDGTTMVVFVDCSIQIESNNRIVETTMLVCAAGLLITFVLVWIFSKKAIRPEIENAKKQKQFITNASHELKTPLAVIRANTEIEEMTNGETEWSQSTMRQVERLDGLVQNLVMIARSEEQEEKSMETDVDVSKIVNESIDPFAALAMREKKKLVKNIGENVHMTADGSKIRQLMSLLIDNAIKYCDDDGIIEISLESIKKGRSVKIAVSNSYKDGKDIDCSKFFERFYRQDESHNVDKGGYGIGLSMAESICRQYDGSIDAAWNDGVITFTCILK